MHAVYTPLTTGPDFPLARSSPTRQAEEPTKAATRRTDDDLPVHSFPSLMRDLATITKNTIQPRLPGAKPFTKTTLPTTFQRRVFTLLQVPPP